MALIFPTPAQAALQTPVWTFSDVSTPLTNTVNGVTYYYDNILGVWLTESDGGTAPPGGVSSVNVSGGTTGLTYTGGPITSSGLITMAGTLALTNGGTGATTQAGAQVNLLPAQAGNAGKVLSTNGAGLISWVPPGGAPTLQQVTDSGATTTDVITIGGLISNGTLLPGAHEVYDLGSPTAAWQTLYCKNSSIYLGAYKLSIITGQIAIDDVVAVVTGTAPISVSTGPNPEVSIAEASTTQAGAVQLSDSTTSTSTTQAATASAVNEVYNQTLEKMPLAGGNFTGDVTFDAGTTAAVDTGANFTMDGQGSISGSINFEGSSTTTFQAGSTLVLDGTVTFNTAPTFPSGVDIGPSGQVTYTPTSPLTATNVQDALDELATSMTQGTVTSVGITGTSGIGVVSGSPVTTSGSITLAIDIATLPVLP
jgi:hypothetical protein